MDNKQFILLNIIVLTLFTSIYYTLSCIENNKDDPAHPLKSIFHGLSVHIPFCGNDFNSKSYTGRVAVLLHNITVQVLLVSSGIYSGYLLGK
jgi:hypothetical protein